MEIFVSHRRFSDLSLSASRAERKQLRELEYK